MLSISFSIVIPNGFILKNFLAGGTNFIATFLKKFVLKALYEGTHNLHYKIYIFKYSELNDPFNFLSSGCGNEFI